MTIITPSLKFIDLFAGIGGFRLAFEPVGYQCVYSCEINEACQKVYYNNFGKVPDTDVAKISPNNLPNFDVLTAGFPCQPFSISGKKQGFKDTRGTLFFHICEIIEVKEPPVIILENVKHLIHHQRCQIIINGTLPTLKYYLRLITSIEKFLDNYSKLIELDQELQAIHKIKWNEILSKLNT
ncbi:MAG: DNA (cytosine-5-)-methyltransferase [Crocosphaera sp.]|nr:DNA (cytosine-5-)-methyltransferase [Crocosphaera sp.]